MTKSLKHYSIALYSKTRCSEYPVFEHFLLKYRIRLSCHYHSKNGVEKAAIQSTIDLTDFGFNGH